MRNSDAMQDSQPFLALYAPPQAALSDRPGEAPAGAMRIECEVAMRDLMRFRLLHVLTAKGTYISALIWIPLATYFIAGFHGIGNFLYVAGCGGIAFFVFVLLLQILVTLLQRKNAYLGRHAIELREDGFYDETAHSRCLHYWAGILRVVERPGYLAVYIRAQAAYFVPDHAFSGEVSRERFLALARQRVAAARAANAGA